MLCMSTVDHHSPCLPSPHILAIFAHIVLDASTHCPCTHSTVTWFLPYQTRDLTCTLTRSSVSGPQPQTATQRVEGQGQGNSAPDSNSEGGEARARELSPRQKLMHDQYWGCGLWPFGCVSPRQQATPCPCPTPGRCLSHTWEVSVSCRLRHL